MDSLLDSPFVPTVAACVVAGLLLSLLARLTRALWLAGLVAPVVFLASYYETYNKIPAFPPAGSTNKIFYVVLAATLAGLVFDLLAPPRIAAGAVRWVVLLAASLLIVVWIGLPRFADAAPALAVVVAALVAGGTLVLWRLASVDDAEPAPLGGPVLLAVLPGVFAPIALFGGSSTSVGLCLGLTAGLAMMALVNLFAPRRLGLTAVLGAGCGVLAMVDTITLITQRIDFLALAIFLAVLFIGQIGARALLPQGRINPRVRAIAAGLLAASPVVVIVVLLFLRHDSPL